jgi:molybdopterin-guanine dinucleotide biosynthesis protein B
MQHCDLVLIEGFKGGNFPKLEVWRDVVGRSTLWPQWPGIVALASDQPVSHRSIRVLDLSDVVSIANFVLEHAITR